MEGSYDSTAPGEDVCWTFAQSGHCPRGNWCRWEHRGLGQENGAASCRAWLLWGECPRGDNCQWEHPVQDAAAQGMQCIPVPVLGIVPGPPWVPYYSDGGNGYDGYNLEAPSKAASFDMAAFFRDAEASNMDNVPSSKHGEEPKGLPFVRIPERDGYDSVVAEVALEEMGDLGEEWDQFEANRKMFGVTSSFNEDLSQYTTALDIAKVPAGVRYEADRIANELRNEHKLQGRQDDDYRETVGDEESTDDEEARFSAVCNPGKGKHLVTAAVRA